MALVWSDLGIRHPNFCVAVYLWRAAGWSVGGAAWVAEVVPLCHICALEAVVFGRPRRPRVGILVEGDAIDPYQVLGVAHDASTEEVRRAYRRLARQHHPDLDPGPRAAERFRLINEAYRTLTDGPARAAFDATHAPAGAFTGPAPEPAPQPAAEPTTPPVAGTNRLAAASILVSIAAVCLPGPLLFGWYLGPIGALLGHAARWQIRRSGEAGAGLALAGIAVGWGLTVMAVAATAVGVLISRVQ
jgi:hypothetical protein